jgi:alkyl hydroperoxide reductase subunit D
MNLEAMLQSVPEYAKDLKLNFTSVVGQTELTPQQTWGTAVASANASGNHVFLSAVEEEASKHLTPQAIQAAKSAAAIMAMNNVYYRFKHLASNQKYGTMPARLRMNVLRTHGVEAADFELWCLAVSAINGCGACVDAHEKVVREKGLSEDAVLASVRIASVVRALAAVLSVERTAQAEAVSA